MSLFKGRMNRATYWSSLAFLVCFWAVFRQPSASGSFVGVLFGMSVYRLHDLGRSGKWALGPLLLAATVMILSLLVAAKPGAAAATPMALIVLAGMLVNLGLVTWLGSLPGQPDKNRYGAPPKPGVTFFKAKRAAPAA